MSSNNFQCSRWTMRSAAKFPGRGVAASPGKIRKALGNVSDNESRGASKSPSTKSKKMKNEKTNVNEVQNKPHVIGKPCILKLQKYYDEEYHQYNLKKNKKMHEDQELERPIENFGTRRSERDRKPVGWLSASNYDIPKKYQQILHL